MKDERVATKVCEMQRLCAYETKAAEVGRVLESEVYHGRRDVRDGLFHARRALGHT